MLFLNNYSKYRFKTGSGFSIIEIIVVMVLLGILLTLTMNNIGSNKAAGELRKSAEKMKTYIQYAQTRAMSSNKAWGIAYDSSSNEYWLFSDEKSEKRMLPSEDKEVIELSQVKIGSKLSAISFDKWGTPYIGTEQNADTKLSDDKKIIITYGSQSTQFTITPETGYIKDE